MGLYRGYTGVIWDTGKENGNYYSIEGHIEDIVLKGEKLRS